MPFIRDNSPSSGGSSTESNYGYPSPQSIVDDETYAAKLLPTSAEKPLSEQLEPIAVVGMGCRLPGEVKSASGFWKFMMDKKTGQTPKVPKSRFNIDAHFHANNDRPGSFNVLGGYFLADETLEEFDPSFFGITPIEAMWMDPQQRKLLEVVYEAFESAGVTLDAVAGSKTAVFAASFTADFQQMCFKEPSFRHSFAATGVDPGILSNRISHVFNLRGPSIVVNTACSSSVYAVHNACNALRNKECAAAVVGGVNLVLTVDQHMNTAKLGVLSPNSACSTFDAAADGYGRAEGVGAVYLKRLSDAVRDGDPIRAVIRSSATNNNGRVPAVGITHPNRDGQVEVITHAYQRGGNLDPLLTGYFECHGTGTAVGDPLEVHAVSLAMNQSRRPGEDPLMIGAVKTNIGHSEAASGLSALIKAVLSVERGVVLPTRLKTPSPSIKWDQWAVTVPTEPKPFRHSQIKRVSVNSFGYGGTNAHIIVEGANSLLTRAQSYRYNLPENRRSAKGPRGTFHRNRPFLLTFSAHDKAALQRNLDVLGPVSANYNLLDLAYTLGNRRTMFSSRAFKVINRPELDKGKFEGLSFAENKSAPVVGFVFTGQGAQWARMGAELMTYYPSFLRTIQMLDMILGDLDDGPDWTLEDMLLEPAATSLVDEAEYAQPLTTAIQIALVQLMRSWSIVPAVTVGHSSGEIAAAYAAGLVSASHAIVLAYLRGKVVRDINTDGAMLAVGLGAEAVEPYLAPYHGQVTVACHNSPAGVTLSGDAPAIEKLRGELTDLKIFARAVRTSGKAYHSAHMAPAAERYEQLFRSAKESMLPFDLPLSTDAKMVSSVTNSVIPPDQAVDEVYFSQNLRSPVLFNQAVQTIMTSSEFAKVDMLIEVGPHSAMGGPIRQIKSALGHAKMEYLPTLVRGEDSAARMLMLAGELFLRNYGLDIDRVTSVEALDSGKVGKVVCKRGDLIVDLPPYQWSRKSYWAENRPSIEHRAPKYARHDLLGALVPGVSPLEPSWRNFLRIRDVPWLKDHSLGGEAVFPAAGYFSMAMEAITQLKEMADKDCEIINYVLRDISIHKALVTPDDDIGIEVIFNMRPAINNDDDTNNLWWDFTVSSIDQDGTLRNHMAGSISVNVATQRPEPRAAKSLKQRASGKEWNQALRGVGFDYGPTFADMTNINFNGVDYLCTCKTKVKTAAGNIEGESRHVLHPSTVDSCLQLMIASIYAGRSSAMSAGIIPIQVDEVAIWKPTASQVASGDASATAWTDERGIRSFVCGNQLVADDGQVLMQMRNMRGTLYDAAVPQTAAGTVGAGSMPYGEMTWKRDLDSVEQFESLAQFVELAVFKDPSHRVLDVGGRHASALLGMFSELRYTAVAVAEADAERVDEEIAPFKNAKREKCAVDHASISETMKKASVDVIVCNADDQVDELLELLAANGRVLRMDGGKLSGVRTVNQVPRDTSTSDGEVQILYRTASSSVLSEVIRSCSSMGLKAQTHQLSQAKTILSHVIVLDLEKQSLLSDITKEEFEVIQSATSQAKTLLWATGGALLRGQTPEAAMVAGLLRSVRSENAAINAVTLDFDLESTSTERLAASVARTAAAQLTGDARLEPEYQVSADLTYISRLLPNESINKTYGTNARELDEILFDFDPATPLRGKVRSGKVVFAHGSLDATLAPTEVEVRVTLAGLNRESIQVIAGTDISTEFSNEIGGVVGRVGSAVEGLAEGDSVVGFSLSGFDTHQVTSELLLQKAHPNEPVAELAGLPLAYSSALYAVQHLAKTQPGEVVLILPGTGLIGAAAIEAARASGATPYVFVADEAEASQLQESYGLDSAQLLSSAEELLAYLRGPGGRADVVLGCASTPAALSRESWRHIAAFGRYVDCGRKRVLKRNTLDPVPFQRGANYFSFDMLELCRSKPAEAGRVLAQVLDLYRSGQLRGWGETRVRNLAELNDAVAGFRDDFGASKILLAYEKSDMPLLVAPSVPTASLDADASYLLVGCLGGLGRSLTSWMMKRGARNFCFLGRSGADAKDAAVLVEELKAAGANVQVIRGDVSVLQDVKRAVSHIPHDRPLRGVVHAAMVLRDSLFYKMSYQDWIVSTRPKVQGAANLQAVLTGTELDFFLVTSSVSGILGTPGQPSYAAANAYLDALAHHRRVRGEKSCSAILPMILGVGVVSENTELEESLKRKGMYGIDEEFLLRSMELAIHEQQTNAGFGSQVVIGLDPSLLSRAKCDAGDVEPFWMADKRFRMLVHNMTQSDAGSSANGGAGATALASVLAAPSPEEALQAAREHVIGKLSRMLLLDLDVFDSEGSVASYGIDSMIGAEFRNWLFTEFAIDIPFQKLLAATMTPRKLASQICANNDIFIE
ncbi:lovastatin nonaketide synthase [Apiospora arundinis]|uniref:Lovastatin nonaketide synthase n=1 Tax=Apiospora arundinis TaxID=335852 RepID=A0ABR2I841_9PEZI